MAKAAATLIVEKAQPELRLRSLVRMLLHVSLRMGVSLPKLLRSRLKLLMKRLIKEAEVL